jgi:hypothetical protein
MHRMGEVQDSRSNEILRRRVGRHREEGGGGESEHSQHIVMVPRFRAPRGLRDSTSLGPNRAFQSS